MKNKLFWFVTFIAFVTLSGCLDSGGSSGSGSDSSSAQTGGSPSTETSNITLNLNFSSLFSGDQNLINASLNVLNSEMLINQSEREVNASEVLFASETFLGTLTLKNAGTTAYAFPISFSLDDATWDAQLQQTFTVKPDTYEFIIQFQKNNYLYAGLTTATVSEGDNPINLAINPVIGDTTVGTTVTIETPKFSFDYSAVDFSSLSNPVLEVIIDGSADTMLSLSQFDGTNAIFINLSGEHLFELLLRDGTTDVARYSSGGLMTFEPGTNLIMNLTAVFGRVGINLSESGGEATFNFNIPGEVIDEVGGTDFLRATFTLDGDKNDLTNDVLDLSSVPDVNGDYSASTTISGIQYDTLLMNLKFEDISASPEETIGSCSFSVALDGSDDTSSACEITLVRKATISGLILQAVAFNVVDTTGDAISLAGIYMVDGTTDVLLGSTGAGLSGTSGYFEEYLKPGTYTFKAKTGDKWGEAVDVVIDQWDTGYVFIQLSYDLLVAP